MDTYDFSIGPLDDELVLEHDEIALAGAVRHERLELCAERVEEVAGAGGEGLRREEADPAQT